VRLVASLALILALLPIRRSFADASEPDRVYAEGVELRRQNKDLEALDRFRRAHALQPAARTQAQIGFAEQALGRWADAERDLTAALAMHSDAWLEKNRAAINRALAVTDEHLGTLQIEGAPAGAEVRVDGASVGTLPLAKPLRVPAGMATVELSAEGHAPALRTVPIAARRMHRERLDLVKLGMPPAAITAPAAAAEVRRGPRPHDRRLWLGGWALFGIGAGLLGAGGAGVGIRESSAERFNSDSCVGNGLTRAENCGGSLDTALAGDKLAISGFVLGGVLVVGAIGMLAADATRRREAR
jgi:tetratricopeptide (TPR) repeat protein